MLGTRIHVWAKLYRKSFLEAVGVSYPEGLRYEDSYFSIICAAYAGRLYVIKDILYLYRQNPDSIMHSDRTKYYYMDGFYVAEKTYEELKRRNLLDRYREQIAAYYFNNSYFKTLCLMTSHMYGMELDMKNLQMIVNRMFELFPDILENQCLINSAEKYPEIGKAMKLLEKK
jgi:hypothetical protein